MRLRHTLLPCFALILLILNGCSDPQKQGPTPTAQAFLEALQKEDFSNAKSYATEASGAQLDRLEERTARSGSHFQSPFEITSEEIRGNEAHVQYLQEGRERTLQLLKKDERWEVALSKSDFGSKVEDQIGENLEESFEKLGDGLKQMGEELEEGLEDFADRMDSIPFELPPPPPMPILEMPEEEPDLEETEPLMDTGLQYLEFRKGKSPREIADKFLTALKYADVDKARHYASRRSHKTLEWYATSGNSPMDDFSIVDVVEDGDYRQVHYVDASLDSATKILKLGKDSQGNWEVIMTKTDLQEMN